MLTLLVAWGVVGSGLWIIGYLLQTIGVMRLPRLADATAPPPARWPRLSVVIAACNEAATIEPAMATLLALDYPALEIVVVDDRSTDGTGALIDAIAARDPRVRAVHVAHLPAGWLGKVHALDVGARQATGELILFTDADVHFAPDALGRAVALLLADRLDHLTVLPDMRAGSLFEDVMIAAVGGMFLRKTGAARPRARGYAGVGAFNLVRRDALRASEGFEFLRLEVVDDIGVGLLMQRAGKRSRLVLGADMVSLVWYGSLPAMARGMEKNLFALLGRFRWPRLCATALATWAIGLAPAAALASGDPRALVLGGAALALVPVTAAIAARRTGRRFVSLVLLPLGELMLPVLAIRSALVVTRLRGVEWRGTHYPLALLRAHQRVLL
jgi:cellulose synthase/poly-beta-1,6-N-acetylglucosamine synthase-like glycosyltransferase